MQYFIVIPRSDVWIEVHKILILNLNSLKYFSKVVSEDFSKVSTKNKERNVPNKK